MITLRYYAISYNAIDTPSLMAIQRVFAAAMFLSLSLFAAAITPSMLSLLTPVYHTARLRFITLCCQPLRFFAAAYFRHADYATLLLLLHTTKLLDATTRAGCAGSAAA